MNLIHVDDAAHAVLAAEQVANMPSQYVIADGHPVRRGDYFRELARLTSAPMPQFVPPMPDEPVAQRGMSNKRVSSRQMREGLKIKVQYPSYREGLASILASESPG